jgi:hypothetical protein
MKWKCIVRLMHTENFTEGIREVHIELTLTSDLGVLFKCVKPAKSVIMLVK